MLAIRIQFQDVCTCVSECKLVISRLVFAGIGTDKFCQQVTFIIVVLIARCNALKPIYETSFANLIKHHDEYKLSPFIYCDKQGK